MQRLVPLADRPSIVVTGAVHAAPVQEQAGAREEQGGASMHPARFLAEPSPRNIVGTEDALLVLADEHAQELSRLVGQLHQRGRDDLC